MSEENTLLERLKAKIARVEAEFTQASQQEQAATQQLEQVKAFKQQLIGQAQALQTLYHEESGEEAPPALGGITEEEPPAEDVPEPPAEDVPEPEVD